MDRVKVEKLIEIVGPEEQATLKILYNASLNTMKAYQDDPNKPADKLRAWRAAETELAKVVDAAEAKYLTRSDRIKNAMAAVRYLKDNGWKLEKSKLYKDKDAGLIRFNADKSVDEVVLLAYAAKWLEKARAAGDNDTGGALAEERLTEEISVKRLQAEKIRFELDRERGKYIPRVRWLTELVSKLSAARSTAILVAQRKAPDIIAAVGGNQKKESVFVELFTTYLEDAFNELADVPELKFSIEPQEDPDV